MEEFNDRRIEMASKMSMLEERSMTTNKTLDRIEGMLVQHTIREEEVFKEMKESIEVLHNKIDPVQKELSKYKNIVTGVAVTLSSIGTIWYIFKDAIHNLFR